MKLRFLFLLSAPEPPSAPILRIEAGMHTARIDRFATDAEGRVALTCGAESFRFPSDLVKEFQNTNLEALSHRGLGVKAGDAPLVGRALRLYRVEGGK